MRTTSLTTPLTWLGDAPPAWLAPCLTGGPPEDAEVVATRGDDAALRRLRARAPGALLVAVVPVRTPEVELARLEAGASLVVDGAHPELDITRVNALVRTRRRTRSRIRALELSVSLLRVAKDEDAFLQQLSAVIADELTSDRVSIMQLDAEQRVLLMRAAVGISPEVVSRVRTPVGQGIAGVAAQTGQPIYVDDHARIRAGDVTPRDLARAAPGTPMSLTVPIKVRGQVVGVVNVTDRRDKRPYGPRDITFIDYLTREVGFLLENARLMSRLQRLTAFNESVIDTLNDPLVVIDPERRISATNHRFESLFGGHAEGRLLLDVLPTDAAQQALLIQMADGASVPPEQRSAWPVAGRRFDVTASHFESEGRQMCLVLLRDVTDRVDRERRLVEAEKMASLGVLAAGIAHEINNPIAYVKANASAAGEYLEDLIELAEALRDPHGAARAEALFEALAFDTLRADVKAMGEEISQGIDRVVHIVKGLKSFVHPDTEQTRETDLNGLVEGALLLTKGKWKHCLDVDLALGTGLPPIACLPMQLEQVLVNLVVNVCQAAEGQRHLRIETAATEGRLHIRLTDDCGGIPAEVRGRVFEPFFTTKDIGEGSGLGLAISRNIVAAHGGSLTFEVEDGVGTSFLIDLPRGEAGRPLVVKQLSRYRV